MEICFTVMKGEFRSKLNFSLIAFKYSILNQGQNPLGFSSHEVQLSHNMENGNKRNETNAHDEYNVGGDLEARSIIRVKLQHCSSCPSRCT